MEIYDPRRNEDMQMPIGNERDWSSLENQAFVVRVAGGWRRGEDRVRRLVDLFDCELLCILVDRFYGKLRSKILARGIAEPIRKLDLIAKSVSMDDFDLPSIYTAMADGKMEHVVICGYDEAKLTDVCSIRCDRDWMIDDALDNWGLFEYVMWFNIDMSDFMAFFRDERYIEPIRQIFD
ncbi:MAG: hypothetical protein KKA42_01345 [candidate division Zixibacteria bacterium]|nr:hypothetical protein [candidate division Zixibacteria bacterium]